MRRYVLMATVAGLLLLAVGGLVWMRSSRGPGTTRFEPGVVVRGPTGEVEEYRTQAGANPRWPGAGRHEQWRGCRHTYQPALTAWLSVGRAAGGAGATPAG